MGSQNAPATRALGRQERLTYESVRLEEAGLGGTLGFVEVEMFVG
jgi:hypothetical protein